MIDGNQVKNIDEEFILEREGGCGRGVGREGRRGLGAMVPANGKPDGCTCFSYRHAECDISLRRQGYSHLSENT